MFATHVNKFTQILNPIKSTLSRTNNALVFPILLDFALAIVQRSTFRRIVFVGKFCHNQHMVYLVLTLHILPLSRANQISASACHIFTTMDNDTKLSHGQINQCFNPK